MKLLAGDLVKIFNGNQRWKPTEVNIKEAGIISSGFAFINMQNLKFASDISDIVRHKIKDA